MSGTLLKSLAGVTIVTPDLDAAIAAYRDFLGYCGDAPEPVGEALARVWSAPEAASARMATLWPESGERRFIRLVEGDAPGFEPLTTLGWTAAEIVVQDLDALADRLADSPFDIIGPPAVLDFDFTDKIRAMQVVGPGGEILYLTEIGGEIPGFELPTANSFVGQLFIMVLAGRDIAPAAQPYADLGRPVGPEMQARIDVLSNAHGLPVETRHRLATIALDDRSLIEVDAFPAAATARAASTVGLPAGIAMASFHADGDHRVLAGASGEWIETLPPTYNEKV
jgi:catechol 2,3-dioxygenase-like lactoylglutathione lyase family enzyme